MYVVFLYWYFIFKAVIEIMLNEYSDVARVPYDRKILHPHPTDKNCSIAK